MQVNWNTSLGFQSTLPRGERQLQPSMIKLHFDFNPRSHEGSDVAASAAGVDSFVFQSTLPRGERPNDCIFYRYFNYFNPRSHEGSDSNENIIISPFRYFNPRSHEGSDKI